MENVADLESVGRGAKAKEVLDTPALADGFKRLEDDLIAAWRATGPDERDTRESLYGRLRALESLRQELRLMVEEGELAKRRTPALQAR